MVAMVVFIVLMILWLFGGGWIFYNGDPTRRYLGSHLLAWLCVAILGYVVFNGVVIAPPPH